MTINKIKIRIIIFAVAVFMLNSCGEDKVIQPEPNPLEGIWAEVYFTGIGLDPDGFIFDSSWIPYDSGGVYEPPEIIQNDTSYIIYGNDTLFVSVDSTGQTWDYYFLPPLTSTLIFEKDNFNLKITHENGLIEKEAAGSYQTISDTIIFNINYRYYRYYEAFNFDYDQNALLADTMLFNLNGPDSLNLSEMTIDMGNGVITISYGGFPWYIPSTPPFYKNSGVFVKE